MRPRLSVLADHSRRLELKLEGSGFGLGLTRNFEAEVQDFCISAARFEQISSRFEQSDLGVEVQDFFISDAPFQIFSRSKAGKNLKRWVGGLRP